MPIVHTRPSLSELSVLLAQGFIEHAKQNIETQGSFHAAFSGGKTPQLFYALLAQPLYAERIQWAHVHIYLSDERFVPFTHIDNNFAMIKATLLDHVPIPDTNIHYIKMEDLSPHEAALDYEIELKNQLPKDINQRSLFDFILLGIGEDGHVASLFPATTILGMTDKMAAAVFVNQLQAWRISLTFPSINSAKYVAILAGQNKAHIIQQVFSDHAQAIYPIQMLEPEKQLEWYTESV